VVLNRPFNFNAKAESNTEYPLWFSKELSRHQDNVRLRALALLVLYVYGIALLRVLLDRFIVLYDTLGLVCFSNQTNSSDEKIFDAVVDKSVANTVRDANLEIIVQLDVLVLVVSTTAHVEKINTQIVPKMTSTTQDVFLFMPLMTEFQEALGVCTKIFAQQQQE